MDFFQHDFFRIVGGSLRHNFVYSKVFYYYSHYNREKDDVTGFRIVKITKV